MTRHRQSGQRVGHRSPFVDGFRGYPTEFHAQRDVVGSCGGPPSVLERSHPRLPWTGNRDQSRRYPHHRQRCRGRPRRRSTFRLSASGSTTFSASASRHRANVNCRDPSRAGTNSSSWVGTYNVPLRPPTRLGEVPALRRAIGQQSRQRKSRLHRHASVHLAAEPEYGHTWLNYSNTGNTSAFSPVITSATTATAARQAARSLSDYRDQ